jgi:hypothetical protein
MLVRGSNRWISLALITTRWSLWDHFELATLTSSGFVGLQETCVGVCTRYWHFNQRLEGNQRLHPVPSTGTPHIMRPFHMISTSGPNDRSDGIVAEVELHTRPTWSCGCESRSSHVGVDPGFVGVNPGPVGVNPGPVMWV